MSTVTAWQVIGGRMSYIDALYKKDEDKIYVVEHVPGIILSEYPALLGITFYDIYLVLVFFI